MDNIYNRILKYVIDDNDAILFENQRISFKAFMNMIDSIADLICEKKITQQGIIVGLPRSPYMIAAFVAIIKSGNYYIPIDLSYPKNRTDYIIKHSGASYVIVDDNSKTNFAEIEHILISEIKLLKNNVFLEHNNLNDIAYCIYTSGSTGNPKGVLIKEDALLNFIDGINESLDLSEIKNVLCITTQCFDVFFLESIMALCLGITVVLCNESICKNPKELVTFISWNKVDMIQMTPSRIQMLKEVDKDLECFQRIKLILAGGEALSERLLKVLQNVTKAKIYNMYGPTETTIWSLVCDLTDRDRVLIGKPIINTQVYILNEELSEVMEGQEGEICIAGKGLAVGYLNDEQKTNQNFVRLDNGRRIYRTGDYGRKDSLMSDYLFLGRRDNQVKLNGHRIELEEIEAVANRIEGITNSIAEVYKNDTGSDKLRLYYTSNFDVSIGSIIAQLSKWLPNYMIPNSYARVSEFNFTSNGKLDRKELPQVNLDSLEDVNSENCDGIEDKINEIIYKCSNVAVTRENKHLIFELINSIDFVKIIVTIEDMFEIEFDQVHLVQEEYTSIDYLYSYVKELLDLVSEVGIIS